MEDTDFYDHNGINIKGIMRALYRDIIAMSFVEGGSTLTQQLARNLFLEKQKKIERKIKEILMALEIERKYTKTEILELYLNQVYWGHNAYGIESASQMYFGKNAKNLTVAESAALVGMLKGPELFSPFRYFERLKKRQRVVLKRMQYLGMLTAEEVDDEIYYRFRGYYNGQLLNDGITYNNWNRNVNNISKLFIGASGPSMNHHFKGKVDDLRIYDGALSDEEINSLYNQNKLDDNNEDDLMYQVDIGQGDLTKTVYLYANDDNVFDEGDEVTTLTIDSVINGHVSSVSSSISSTIIDNDVRPDINLIIVSGDTLVEGSDSSATVRATLSEVTTRDVKISLGSSDIETDGFAGPNDFEIFDDSVVDESMALHLTFDGNTDDVSGNENNGVATNVALTGCLPSRSQL